MQIIVYVVPPTENPFQKALQTSIFLCLIWNLDSSKKVLVSLFV